MSRQFSSATAVIIFTFALGLSLRADQLDMQNGDRYLGKVLSVTADTVTLQSDVLGRVNIPRSKVSGLTFGTTAPATPAPKAEDKIALPVVSTNLPVATPQTALASTNVDLSAAFRSLGSNTNFVRQVREQMLAGSPEAAAKYDELVGGLMSGKLNMNDLRREAKSAADQLRTMKRELGPEADEAVDGYLQLLDGFLKSSAANP